MAESRTALSTETARLTTLVEGLREARKVRWHIDVDPLET